jgi:hypothetical protein
MPILVYLYSLVQFANVIKSPRTRALDLSIICAAVAATICFACILVESSDLGARAMALYSLSLVIAIREHTLKSPHHWLSFVGATAVSLGCWVEETSQVPNASLIGLTIALLGFALYYFSMAKIRFRIIL